MSKRMNQCPICRQWFRDVKGHTARMHKEAPTPETKETRRVSKGKTLELTTPTEKETLEPQGYHCVDCGGSLTKGQNPCPHCGTHLDWSSL